MSGEADVGRPGQGGGGLEGRCFCFHWRVGDPGDPGKAVEIGRRVMGKQGKTQEFLSGSDDCNMCCPVFFFGWIHDDFMMDDHISEVILKW